MRSPSARLYACCCYDEEGGGRAGRAALVTDTSGAAVARNAGHCQSAGVCGPGHCPAELPPRVGTGPLSPASRAALVTDTNTAPFARNAGHCQPALLAISAASSPDHLWTRHDGYALGALRDHCALRVMLSPGTLSHKSLYFLFCYMLSVGTILWPPSQIIMRNAVPTRHFLTRTMLAHARSEISMHMSNEILLSDFAQPDASGSVRNHYAALCFVRCSICVLARHRPSQGCNSTDTRGSPRKEPPQTTLLPPPAQQETEGRHGRG